METKHSKYNEAFNGRDNRLYKLQSGIEPLMVGIYPPQLFFNRGQAITKKMYKGLVFIESS